MTVQTIDPASIPVRFTNTYLTEVTTLSTNYRLIGMSPDATKIYARGITTNPDNQKTLYQSVDDGDNWTTVNTFAFNIEGMTFLDNGEVIVVCQGGTASPGYLYKSTNWSPNPATATWTNVFQTQAGYIRSVWGMNQFCHAENYIVTCEYGVQTDSGTDQSAKATRVYWSEDAGNTWRVILDLTVMFPGVVNLHCHAVAYDKKWDRIWFTYGDASGHLASNKSLVMYSDDHGLTWDSFTVPTEWTGAGTFQSTTIALTEEAIVLAPDGVPYSTKTLLREGYRKQGGSRLGAVWAGNTGAQGIAYCAFKSKHLSTAPMFLTTQGASAQVQALILVNPLGKGAEWIEIFRDTTNNTSTVHFIVGPTARGNVVFALGNTMRRAVYSPPAGGYSATYSATY